QTRDERRGTLLLGLAWLGLVMTAASRAEGRKEKTEPASPPVPPGVLFERDLEYSSPAKGLSLKLDVARPARAKKPCPAVVLIPGGTWLGGRREGTRPLQFALAARGFVAVSIDYRQNPDQPFPRQLNDAKCAVRWLRTCSTAACSTTSAPCSD